MHSIIKKAWDAISDTANFKLIDFVSVFPAQIGLLGIQMLWSRDAEVALSAAKSDKKVMYSILIFLILKLNKTATFMLIPI